MSKLYPRNLGTNLWFKPVKRLIDRSILSNITVPGTANDGEDFQTWLNTEQTGEERSRFTADLTINESEWLRILGFSDTMTTFLAQGPKVLDSMLKREKGRTSVMQDFLISGND